MSSMLGDKVVYFEIDSFLPQIPLSEFNINSDKVKEGDDLTDKLNVKLWDTENPVPPVYSKREKSLKNKYRKVRAKITKYIPILKQPLSYLESVLFRGTKVNVFPTSIIKKTDQNRIQNIISNLNFLKKFEYEVTIKLDGCSGTYYKNGRDLGICSRNYIVTGKEDRYNKINDKYKIIDALKKLNKNIAIQGEIIGEGINGNNESIKDIDFHVFDIYDIDKKRYMTADERYDIMNELIDYDCILKSVPVMEEEKSIKGMSLEDILEYAKGESLYAKMREGSVFKSTTLDPQTNQTVSFKVISNDYLLKKGR